MGNQAAIMALSPAQQSDAERAAIRRILFSLRERLDAITFDLISLARVIGQDPDALTELETEISEYS